jgi:hypothetical protein
MPQECPLSNIMFLTTYLLGQLRRDVISGLEGVKIKINFFPTFRNNAKKDEHFSEFIFERI